MTNADDKKMSREEWVKANAGRFMADPDLIVKKGKSEKESEKGEQ